MNDNNKESIQLVECPRDAMQGWKTPIPAAEKAAYLNQLLQVGFHTLDFGSFVSPKAIPQMADTREVLSMLELDGKKTKLLAIVANVRGAEEATAFEAIDVLGFPFSISPTFQMRNTNSTLEESLARVDEIQHLCARFQKELVIYLSMGFGNPYGDPYHPEILLEWAERMFAAGISTISLADTVGLAVPEEIHAAVSVLTAAHPGKTVGVHLHSSPDNWQAKLAAALDAGTQRVDGALKGVGGCPMADDVLVGNMDTLQMIPYLQDRGQIGPLNAEALAKAAQTASRIFS